MHSSLRERLVGLTRMRIVRDLLMTFGGRWVQILLGLVGNVLSARALGPAEFGRFGLVIAVIMVFGTLADAGLTYSAIRLIARHGTAGIEEAHAVARGYFSLRIASGVSVAVLGFFLSWPLAWALGYPDMVPYLQLAFLTLVSLSISSYPSTILVGLAKFREFGRGGRSQRNNYPRGDRAAVRNGRAFPRHSHRVECDPPPGKHLSCLVSDTA